MPAKKGKTSFGKMVSEAHSEHKADETVFDTGGDLPPNVRGAAELVDIHLGEFESGNLEGERFVYIGSSVVTPEEHEGTRISITIPLCDTPDRKRKTFAENWAFFLNILRASFGVDTEEIELESEDDEEIVAALEALFEELVGQGLQHRFRSWGGEVAKTGPYKGKPGRINYTFGRATDAVESEEDVDDETEEEEEEDDEPTKKTGKAGKKAKEEPEEEEEAEEEEETEDDDVDLAALAKKADKDDATAQHELEAIAKKLKIPAKKVEACDNWKAVVALIEEAQGEDEEAEEEEETEEEETEEEAEGIEKGSVYNLKWDVKLGKASKKAIEVEVLSVNEKAETATVKDLGSGKPILDLKTKKAKSFDFSDLIPIE